MFTLKPILKAGVPAFLAILSLTSCNTSDTSAVVPEPIVVTPSPVIPQPTQKEQLAKLEAELTTVDAEIKAMIGQAQCASSLDCRLLDVVTLPACGGISPFYAAYSILETNQNTLFVTYEQRRELIRKTSSLNTSQNTPVVVTPPDSVCAAVLSSDPVAQCINHQCRGIYSPTVSMGNNAGVTWGEVNAMIGDPVCSSSEQCGVWQVGYSLTGEFPWLCGKDTTFAYSTFATDPKEIAEKVGQYAQSVAANYNAQGLDAVCQSNVSFTNGVCRSEKCEAN